MATSARRSLAEHLDNGFSAWCHNDAVGMRNALMGAQRCEHVIRICKALAGESPLLIISGGPADGMAFAIARACRIGELFIVPSFGCHHMQKHCHIITGKLDAQGRQIAQFVGTE